MSWQILALLLLGGAAFGQEVREAPRSALVSASGAISRQTWTLFAGLGAEIVADGVTTRVLYQRRYSEENPLARPFVQAGVPGQVAVSLLGAGALAGTWWVLHRSHRDRMARSFLWVAVAAEGGNDAREFAILPGSRRATAPDQENSQFAGPRMKAQK